MWKQNSRLILQICSYSFAISSTELEDSVDSFSSSLDVAIAESGLRSLAVLVAEKFLAGPKIGDGKFLKSSLLSSVALLLDIQTCWDDENCYEYIFA